MHSRKSFAAVNIISVLSILLGLWTILALPPCQTTASAAASTATQDVLPLRVMSFNIRYGTANDGENRWEKRRELVFDVLRRHKADVVGLQEALRFQIDEIREALPQYNELGVAREDGGTKGEYCAILYHRERLSADDSATFWFSETPEVPGSSHWGNACVRICTWARFIDKKSGRAFYFFNLHLDHVSQPSREKSAVLLANRIRDRKYPDLFIVTGDFNVGETNPVIRYLKAKASLGEDEAKSTNPVPMVDTFRVLHSDAVEVGTFNGFKGRRDGDKIDYIFTQPGAIVLDAQILRSSVDGRYPSDHFPVVATLGLACARTYHMDSQAGDDQNDGTSPERAWRSLAAVNARVFRPGERILFKAGTSYRGLLKPQGCGTEANPIVIDMYGSGGKPRIDGEGIRDTLWLENVEYWEVSNLEITNLGQTRADWRTGVRVSANDYGTVHHIHLRNLYVHDVNGSNNKSREGCGIFFECKGKTPSRFDDLLIENCHLVRTDRNGICGRSSFTNRSRNWLPSLNVVIRGNLLEDIGGDCIKPWGCDGCLVEHNVVRGGRQRAEDYAAGIWPWSCDNTVIQFNEVSGMKGTKDGQGFDSDYNCRNSLFQYNYSHDNDGGFMLICTPETRPGNVGCVGTVVRYNISQNDGARIFHIGGPVQNTRIYNNVFYVPEGRDIYAVLCTDWGGWAKDTYFYNNIFYVEGKVRYEFGRSTDNVFESNVFYGEHENRPDDPSAILRDPMLVNAGSGGDGLDSLAGYKLKPGSPCIGAGVAVENCGGRDFWGNPLPGDAKPNVGAQAAPEPMPNLVLNEPG
jgi:endonuclease/exonuclease/phosphatase family metal-dependent hydrolase